MDYEKYLSERMGEETPEERARRLALEGRAFDLDGRSERATFLSGLQRSLDKVGTIGGVTARTDTGYLDDQAARDAKRSDRYFSQAEADKKARDAERRSALLSYLEMKRGDKTREEGYAREDAKFEKTQTAQAERDAADRRFRAEEAEKNRNAQFALADKKASTTAAAKKPTAEQFKAGGFARRLEQAEQAFSQLEGEGFKRGDRGTAAKNALMPEAFEDPKYKRWSQAERNFVNATLRRESGAAISASEFANAEAQYFPRAGDPPSLIAQKRANRKQILEAMRAEGGDAYNQIPLVDVPMPAYRNKPGTAIAAPKMPSAADVDLMDEAQIDELLKQIGK